MSHAPSCVLGGGDMLWSKLTWCYLAGEETWLPITGCRERRAAVAVCVSNRGPDLASEELGKCLTSGKWS